MKNKMKNKMKKLLSVMLLAVICTVSISMVQTTNVKASALDAGGALYRLYNPNSGEHLITVSDSEKNNLVNAGWNYEGVLGYTAPYTTNQSNTIVRIASDVSGGDDVHMYLTATANASRPEGMGSHYEGVAFYTYASNDSIINTFNHTYLFVLYNPNNGRYTYSTNSAEIDNLVKAGWQRAGTLGIVRI